MIEEPLLWLSSRFNFIKPIRGIVQLPRRWLTKKSPPRGKEVETSYMMLLCPNRNDQTSLLIIMLFLHLQIQHKLCKNLSESEFSIITVNQSQELSEKIVWNKTQPDLIETSMECRHLLKQWRMSLEGWEQRVQAELSAILFKNDAHSKVKLDATDNSAKH